MEVLPGDRVVHMVPDGPARAVYPPGLRTGCVLGRWWKDASVPSARVAVVAVWVLTLLGVVVIDVTVPDAEALSWLALALPLAIVAGIIAQLAAAEQRGFVVRLAATASGSFVLVVLGAIVALAV
jgi:hypothetical protein